MHFWRVHGHTKFVPSNITWSQTWFRPWYKSKNGHTNVINLEIKKKRELGIGNWELCHDTFSNQKTKNKQNSQKGEKEPK